MKTSKQTLLVLGSFLTIFLSVQTVSSQNYKVNKNESSVKIEGTSNIHDWEMVAEDFKGNLNAEMKDGQLVDISTLNFTVVAESLKSGKGGMDKNTYKALKTDKNKSITYQLDKVKNIDCTSNSDCVVSTSGYLTIAGTKKPIDITFNAEVSGNKITLTGNQDIDMTKFNVEPPTAMFGTITTGEDLKINFQTTFSK
ncbi:YceI family protein [Salegentibacter sp. F188]|uniref:YceI family protein n=1 Tax=Autumnicola patrickiae TaxID=3075591 RepID=A0ABU3DZV0_9FLAO|nr:YceI family protein [Salegentibacter sp. F188]MDT0689270.1 YceI family protein [Salegentibacter sp. F188]